MTPDTSGYYHAAYIVAGVVYVRVRAESRRASPRACCARGDALERARGR